MGIFSKIINIFPLSYEKKIFSGLLSHVSNRILNINKNKENIAKEIKFWFHVMETSDRQINLLCNDYYEGKHPKHYLWKEHNRFIFDNIFPGERVLDIGCSVSSYPQWISEKASIVVSIDIDPERIRIAKQFNENESVHYKVMDATKNLPEGQFDVVICSHVLEHLDDPIGLLTRLSEKLPRAIIKVPLADSHWMKLVKQDLGLPWMADPDHRREYTEEMLKDQLEKSGWKVKELIRGSDLRAVALSRRKGKPVKSLE